MDPDPSSSIFVNHSFKSFSFLPPATYHIRSSSTPSNSENITGKVWMRLPPGEELFQRVTQWWWKPPNPQQYPFLNRTLRQQNSLFINESFLASSSRRGKVV